MKKLLILGANSYLGYWIADAFSGSSTVKPIIVGRKKSEKLARFEQYECLDFQSSRLKEFFSQARPDFIINCVGVSEASQEKQMMRWNAEFPQEVVALTKKVGVQPERIIFLGSAAEYGVPTRLPVREDDTLHPLTAYGNSKSALASFVKQTAAAGAPVTLARVFNPVGPGLSSRFPVGNFIEQIKKLKSGDTLHCGDLSVVRDFIDVRDVAAAIQTLLFSSSQEAVFNVCSGESVSLQLCLDELIKMSGKSFKVEEDAALKKTLVRTIYGSADRLKALGWKPRYSLSQTLRYALTY